MKIFKRMAALGFAFMVSQAAQASIVSVNGVDIEALDLNGTYSSFAEFYDFNNANRFSSDTGLEQGNQIVMFFAELNDELGLFTLVSGVGGGRGGAALDISGSEGALTLVDDASEQLSDSSIVWSYDQNRGDGLIYSGLSALGGWTLDLSFSDLLNISGFDFLSFEGGSVTEVNSAIAGNGTSYSASAQAVSEPESLTIFASLLIGLSLIRLRK